MAYQSLPMRFTAAALVALALLHVASAQYCYSSYSGCNSCINSYGGATWCTNSAGSSSGCCTSSGNNCPSSYYYSTSDCTYSSAVNTGQIIYVIFIVIAWIINLVCVIRYCQARNIQATGYICIAIFFGWWVWCCLIPAGRQATQLVIVQQGATGGYAQQGQPYVAPGQPYVAGVAPYGQPGYGQAAPNPYGQPQYAPNPYGQPAPNPYEQAPNPYAQNPNPYPQNPNPYGQPQQPANPYGQPPNPYGGEIVKPQ
jgi:hypothetical protein